MGRWVDEMEDRWLDNWKDGWMGGKETERDEWKKKTETLKV